MTATRTSRWVVAYDCPCDKRRRRIAILLEGYGVRVQDSVFECELAPQVILRLQSRLQRLIHADEDAVRLWPLSRRCCADCEPRQTRCQPWHPGCCGLSAHPVARPKTK